MTPARNPKQRFLEKCSWKGLDKFSKDSQEILRNPLEISPSDLQAAHRRFQKMVLAVLAHVAAKRLL